jgi:hypothetical protein
MWHDTLSRSLMQRKMWWAESAERSVYTCRQYRCCSVKLSSSCLEDLSGFDLLDRCITEQHGSTKAKWRSNILPESIPCNFSRCAIYLNHQTALNKWGKSTLAKGSCSTFTCHREGAEYATLKGDPPFALFCAGLCQIMPMNSCPMGMSTAVFPGA